MTLGAKPTASVIATGQKGSTISVKSIEIKGKEISITLSNTPSFAGTIGVNPKQILGSFGTDTVLYRAKMVRTDAETIDTPTAKSNSPEAMSKAQSMGTRPLILRSQARNEKDADKKKDLLAQADKAQADADEQVPGLYREVIAKNATDPAAIDAATALLGMATRAKLTQDEARKLVKIVETQAAVYGTRYVRLTMTRIGTNLASQRGFEAVAVDALKPVVEGLTDKDPAATQVNVLTAYKTALDGAGRATEAKAIDARLVKMETKLDAEYLANAPIKPSVYSGRKERAANKVAVMELFTGAQCPPCVAADHAFDALTKSYKPTDLVLIQYHMHIPGPDPMTNPATEARWNYYRSKFPMEIRGVPSSVFNGKPAAGGGGGTGQAEAKFEQYRKTIDPLLEESTPVKVGGKASRSGDTVKFNIEVSGIESSDDMMLRVIVVEDTVKFVGGNGIRFHHHVVRAMPSGPAGVAIKDKTFSHSGTADIAAIRKGLTAYLDDFAANQRPFAQPGRPLDMKELSVMALVQNDKTGEIVQAVHIDLAGKTSTGR